MVGPEWLPFPPGCDGFRVDDSLAGGLHDELDVAKKPGRVTELNVAKVQAFRVKASQHCCCTDALLGYHSQTSGRFGPEMPRW